VPVAWHWTVCCALRTVYVMWPRDLLNSLREQIVVQHHSHHTQRSSQRNPNTMLLDSTTVAFEPLAGCMVLLDSG